MKQIQMSMNSEKVQERRRRCQSRLCKQAGISQRGSPRTGTALPDGEFSPMRSVQHLGGLGSPALVPTWGQRKPPIPRLGKGYKDASLALTGGRED